MFGCATYILVFLLGIVTLIKLNYRRAFKYWEGKNVLSLPTTVPFGNFRKFILQQKSLGEELMEIYDGLKTSKKPYYGLYLLAKPVLLILDPDYVKEVMVQGFPSFESRQRAESSNNPLSDHLINLSGSKWKYLRTKLTPTFSSGKMKSMFHTIAGCGHELKKKIDEYATSGEPLEVNDILARFTTDNISSCAFGVESSSLKEPNNEFRQHGLRIFQLSNWEQFKNLIIRFFPFLAHILHMRRLTKETVEFFTNLVTTTIDHREKNNIKRKDFLDLLMQLKSKGYVEDEDSNIDRKTVDTTKLTIHQIAAQSFVFFVGGFETSSGTLTSVMYELARHQNVQDKTRDEIRRVLEKHQGQITYEALMEMVYLEQVIDESMRLHPSVPILTRRCTSDYTFSDGLKIEKGMAIFISAKGFHRDPKYFSNPEKFDPDRFSAEEKSKRQHYVFLPFGAGPRICIGLRFAKIQMKIALIVLLKDYMFTLNSRSQGPLKINPRLNLHNILGGVWLNVEKC